MKMTRQSLITAMQRGISSLMLISSLSEKRKGLLEQETSFCVTMFYMKTFSVILLLAASLLFAGPVFGQTSQVQLTYHGKGGYSLVERTNLLRYVNGKYTGLTSREVRSFISPEACPAELLPDDPLRKERWYDGSFYVLEATKRNGANAAQGIHDSIPSEFRISQEGKVTMIEDRGYPSFRSFPTFPEESLKPGDEWSAFAERSVDPLNKGIFTRMEMLVLYTFAGEEIYHEKEVYRLHASWQTSYGGSHIDPSGDRDLVRAQGGHKAEIIVLKETGEAILVQDQVDETFVFSDKSQVRFKGTISLFTEFPPAVEREKIIPALNRIAMVDTASKKESSALSYTIVPDTTPEKAGGTFEGKSGSSSAGKSAVISSAKKKNMVVEETPAGLRLSVRDIRFKPDSDEILSSEYQRLDEIASVLTLVPNSQFLVEGHTARAGDRTNEKPLSQKRARKVAEELAKRGVSQASFIVRGWGSDRPLAANDTEEGRAINRRVEITILE